MNPRTVIIGIDGVPFELMDDLSDKGVMPSFNELKKQGTFLKMRSSIPHISSVSWSSIITGKNPAEHGIFGFTDLVDNTYTLSFSNFNTLKEDPFWIKNDHKNVIINVPMTYPSKPMNGVHVAGFVALDLKDSVSPKAYLPLLEKLNYIIDVDSGLAHDSKDLFIKQLFETLEIRKKLYEQLWENVKWDVFMFVVTGSDRLGHFMWDAYEEEDHKYHKDFLRYFTEVDKIINDIVSKMDPEDKLIILSDHGMERIKTNVNLNMFLKQENILKLKDTEKNYNKIDDGTKAFAMDPGRIYINLEGKYPRGSVRPEDKEKIIEQLIEIFSKLEYGGKKVIKKIYRKEEIYEGKYLESAPDLILVENPGFRLKGKIDAAHLFEDEVFTGKHTLENSFLYFKNINIDIKNPTVEDVIKLIGE